MARSFRLMPRALIATAAIALGAVQACATEGPTANFVEATLKKPAVVNAAAAERVFAVTPTVRKQPRVPTSKAAHRPAKLASTTDCWIWCGNNFGLLLGIGF
jgi:hypothetical protein